MSKKLNSKETIGTCPECGALVNVNVELSHDHIMYHGECDDHGKFTKKRPRRDFSDMGEQVSSNIGIKGQMKNSA